MTLPEKAARPGAGRDNLNEKEVLCTLDCDQALELISAKIDGELTVEDAAVLDAHLAICPECRALLADFTAMHAAMPAPAAVPSGLSDRVMEQIRQSKVVPMRPAKKRFRQRAWASVAAVLVLVVAGGYALRGSLPGALKNGASSGGEAAAQVQNLPGAADGTASDYNGHSAVADNSDIKALQETPAETLSKQAEPYSGDGSPDWGGVWGRLEQVGLAGPWRGILLLPAGADVPLPEQPDAWQEDCLYYLIPAGDFEILAEKLDGQPDIWLLSEGAGLSVSAPEGLVLLFTEPTQ